MAKSVIKALELGKTHKEQLDLSKEVIVAKDNIIENQKGIIETQIEQKNNFQLAVDEQKKIIVMKDTTINHLGKVVVKTKNEKKWWKRGFWGSVAALIISLFVK